MDGSDEWSHALWDEQLGSQFCVSPPGSMTSSGSSLTLRFRSDHTNHNTIPYGQDKKSDAPIGYRVIVDTGSQKILKSDRKLQVIPIAF